MIAQTHTGLVPLAESGVEKFVDQNSDWITALAILVGFVLMAKVVDWLIGRSANRMAGTVVRGDLSQVAVTRLRVIRRLVFAGIIVIGFALALSQIDAFKPLGTALLASSAVLGIVVGFAARPALANGIAGMMLASVQPFRIGDVIEWDGNRGTVEDLTLTYTFVRLASGHRLVVPNEQIAASPLENFTIAGRDVQATASLWVRPTQAVPALALLRDKLPASIVAPGACEVDRVELNVSFETDVQSEVARTTDLREQSLGILAGAGMLIDEPPAG